MQGSLYHNGGRRIVGGHGRVKHDIVVCCVACLQRYGSCNALLLSVVVGGVNK